MVSVIGLLVAVWGLYVWRSAPGPAMLQEALRIGVLPARFESRRSLRRRMEKRRQLGDLAWASDYRNEYLALIPGVVRVECQHFDWNAPTVILLHVRAWADKRRIRAEAESVKPSGLRIALVTTLWRVDFWR